MALVSSSSSLDLGNLGVGSALPEQQYECAIGPEEDWTGTMDPKVRRKLQNRLNQRAYRRRKMVEKAEKVKNTKTVLQTTPSPSSSNGSSSTSSSNPTINLTGAQYLDEGIIPVQSLLVKHADEETSVAPLFRRGANCVIVTDPVKNAYRLRYVPPKIAPDNLLLSLIHYNVVRAFLSNLQYLNIPLTTLMSDEVQSPFTTSSSVPSNLPVGLQPTLMQMIYPHHPYLDLFPCPKARDNMLERLSRDANKETEDAVCDDLCCTEGESGLIVWGPPERIESWEITLAFAQKWSWLIKGCDDLQRATNKWRVARGDMPIRFEEVNE